MIHSVYTFCWIMLQEYFMECYGNAFSCESHYPVFSLTFSDLSGIKLNSLVFNFQLSLQYPSYKLKCKNIKQLLSQEVKLPNHQCKATLWEENLGNHLPMGRTSQRQFPESILPYLSNTVFRMWCSLIKGIVLHLPRNSVVSLALTIANTTELGLSK